VRGRIKDEGGRRKDEGERVKEEVMKDEPQSDYLIRTIRRRRSCPWLSFILHPSAFNLGKERVYHVPA
jgi:hypothetical protein